MNKHQHRLSFSRAEIVLLNSWMKVQQILYHMLRVFVKTERLTDITDDTGSKILSNYNIKTAMLWACELRPKRWWVDDLNVVRICVELLHTLAVWLTDSRCPHYFVNSCNLFDYPITPCSAQLIANQLMSLTEARLAEWFVQKYIRRCAEHYFPDKVSWLFADVSEIPKLQNAVSAVADGRKNGALLQYYLLLTRAQWQMHKVTWNSLTVTSFLSRMSSLSQIDQRLSAYFVALTLLQGAHKISEHSLTDEFLDVLATTCLQVNDTRRCLTARHSSVLSLNQAAKLMKVAASNSRSTVQLIEIELSKAYLYRALRCKDSDSDCIYCLANVYLAVLYYTTGQYQTAIDHCTLVMRSQDHSQCISQVVQGEILPMIDNIDTVLGLSVCYQYVKTAALNQQLQTQHVSVFTTELFAYYLHIATKCRQLDQVLSTADIKRFQASVCNVQCLFTADLLLCRLECARNNRRLVVANDQAIPLVSHQTNKLVELLQQSAVEHLTRSRQIEAQQIPSVATVVTTDFQALYAYKRGDYQQCLQLTTQNVRMLIAGEGASMVFTFPQFFSLMDDHIVSHTGLLLIADPSCRQDLRHLAISQLSLSLYLMTQCHLQLHHPVSSVAEILDYIEAARIKVLYEVLILDRLMLKLTERKILKYLSVDV